MTNSATVIRQLALDIALWYCLPIAFLSVYVGTFAEPASAVLPHLRVMALPLLAIQMARLLLARLVPGQTAGRTVVSLLVAALVVVLSLYYMLVFIGLSSWGGVISWDVIPTVFGQAQIAADELHMPVTVVDCIPAVLFLALAVGCWFYFKRYDWAAAWAERVSSKSLTLALVSGTAALTIFAFDFSYGAGTHFAEPVSLTLFSSQAALELEGYSANPVKASRMDIVAERAGKAYVPATSSEKKNLILIVVDALRPDHMSLYGYARETMPNLERRSKETPTRVVLHTHASCADTACGLFSLFSSAFPADYAFHPFFLHEALRRNGYRLHLILSGDQTRFFGLKKFYGPVDSFYDGNQTSPDSLNDDQQVLDQLAKAPDWDGNPVMFQFHLMSAHILRTREPTSGPFQPAARYGLKPSHDIGPGGTPPESAVNFYDNGVLKADRVIDAMLAALQSKGYLRRALVVITADHGEGLGEHGLFKHANSVREELLRIPLVFLYFGTQPSLPERPRDYPSQVDISPTILRELDLPLPSAWNGVPLQHPAGPTFSYFQEHAFAGLIDHRDPTRIWKYWIDRGSGQDHVFELRSDPHEDHDLLHSIPPTQLAALRARAHAEMSADLPVR